MRLAEVVNSRCPQSLRQSTERLPARGKEAEKRGEVLASQAGTKFDQAVSSPL